MFNIGDKVTSDFRKKDAKIIRSVISCQRDSRYGSGYKVSADGGEVCPHCGHRSEPIYDVDGSWFHKVKVEEIVK